LHHQVVEPQAGCGWSWGWSVLQRPGGAMCPGADSAGKQGSGRQWMGELPSLVLVQSHDVSGTCIWVWSRTRTLIYAGEWQQSKTSTNGSETERM